MVGRLDTVRMVTAFMLLVMVMGTAHVQAALLGSTTKKVLKVAAKVGAVSITTGGTVLGVLIMANQHFASGIGAGISNITTIPIATAAVRAGVALPTLACVLVVLKFGKDLVDSCTQGEGIQSAVGCLSDTFVAPWVKVIEANSHPPTPVVESLGISV